MARKSGKGGRSYTLIKLVVLLLFFFPLLPSHVVRDRFYISYTRWGMQELLHVTAYSFEQIHPRHAYTAENDERNLYAVWKGGVTRVSARTHSETYMHRTAYQFTFANRDGT